MPPVVAPIVAAATAVKGAVAAAGIMKSMAVAGTALSAVGAVTKNPKLMKIGAVVGTVGTLGSMGAFGAGAKTWGMSGAAKASAASAAPAGSSLTRQALGSTVSSPVAAQPALATAPTRASKLLSQAMGSPVAAPTSAPTGFLARTGAALSQGAQLIKGNPEVAQILAAGGTELANYLSGKTDAEIRALEAQIDATDANAQQTLFALDQEKRRRQNLNQGYLQVNPVVSVPGQPNPYQPPGLLAQNMPGVIV